jgi:hypothetical protein
MGFQPKNVECICRAQNSFTLNFTIKKSKAGVNIKIKRDKKRSISSSVLSHQSNNNLLSG